MDEITFKTAGIGVEYKVKSDLALKAGVKYLEGASRDRGLRADSVDVDTWHPTVGVCLPHV